MSDAPTNCAVSTGSVPSLTSPREELVAYLLSLKAGERVVETSRSALWNRQGTVYINEAGSVCVLWDKHPREEGQMGTTVTGGARRLSDIPNKKDEARAAQPTNHD